MAILDKYMQFTGFSGTAPANTDGATDGAPGTAFTGSQTSSAILDIGVGTSSAPALPPDSSGGGYRDLGIGDDPAMKLFVQVITAFTGGTSFQINLQGAPDNGSGAPGSFVTWWGTPVYTEAQLVAGARLWDIDFPRPPAGVAQARFFQLAYTSVGTHTTGSISGNVVLDRIDQIFNAANNQTLGGYQPGVTIPN
jgi:hypothetical protein